MESIEENTKSVDVVVDEKTIEQNNGNDTVNNELKTTNEQQQQKTKDSSSSTSASSTSTSTSTSTSSMTNSCEPPILSSSTSSLPLNNEKEHQQQHHQQQQQQQENESIKTTIPTAPPSTQRKNTMACEMCNNYEIQLQDIQYREAVLNLKFGQYEKQIKQLKDDLKKEQTFRLELEEKYIDETKQFENNIKQLSQQVDNGRTNTDKIIIKFNKMEKKSNDLVIDLINQIEQLKKEIKRLTIDNEKLLCRHFKKSSEMSSESISLPDDLESLQFYCLQLREDFIQALYNREHLEETLRSENMFLKEQLIGEQQSKEKLEENYSNENELLIKKLQTLELQLNDTLKQNNDLKIEMNLLKNNFNDLSLSSSNQIKELDDKVNELTLLKTKYETDLSTLRAKVQSLQIDLDNSEQVQRDFVKLSQSLQVQLEKIRSSDTEVRWQYDEDINECNGCKKLFHSRKEKINCSHCGRIFCLDCCSKQIRSGPKMRTYKVCQVCHTLLDNQTACWFVNEAPQSPT